jgi:hypothetical protein
MTILREGLSQKIPSCMHDNINIKVENLISQFKWGIVIYYC